MRLDAVGESPLERAVTHTNALLWPLIHPQIAHTLARVIMAGTKLGVFEALEDHPLPAAQIAERCGTDPRDAAPCIC